MYSIQELLDRVNNNKPEDIFIDEMPRGWCIAFGKQMVLELADILEKENFTDKYTLIQAKEKFGMIRWYDNFNPSIKEYDEWLNKYEKLSAVTCAGCGEPATKISQSWICPWCDVCAEDIHDSFKEI